MNDPRYGITSPEYVYSHDQVPIELATSNDYTLDSTGVSCDCVYAFYFIIFHLHDHVLSFQLHITRLMKYTIQL